jgi:hypothetical protein
LAGLQNLVVFVVAVRSQRRAAASFRLSKFPAAFNQDQMFVALCDHNSSVCDGEDTQKRYWDAASSQLAGQPLRTRNHCKTPLTKVGES